MRHFTRMTLYRLSTILISIGLIFVLMSCSTEEDTVVINEPMVFELPTLDYTYDSLEPFIDAETMEIHHTKHHNNYVNNLNAALELHPEVNIPIEQMLSDLSLVPKDIRIAVQNNGGGYYNHALYFSILKINQGQTPSGNLLIAIIAEFGSFSAFQESFTNAALTQFGSGWAWLIVTTNGLKIVQTTNQGTPLSEGTPILCIDVWEHAYYLAYQNRRAEYIEAFYNVINWDVVLDLYNAAL